MKSTISAYPSVRTLYVPAHIARKLQWQFPKQRVALMEAEGCLTLLPMDHKVYTAQVKYNDSGGMNLRSVCWPFVGDSKLDLEYAISEEGSRRVLRVLLPPPEA
jgi:hypothetical protein